MVWVDRDFGTAIPHFGKIPTDFHVATFFSTKVKILSH